eukprot:TRINITY_DN10236_c0_g3_i2.p1 TRINITY_DN10236_c0_g3~~TRINITY_DN10236_c0_g3_i2.p1  ORF type:complete len:466 (+),score=198.38 TRINITY_DN10236_c0_g3_i2:76-1473(+)
MSRVSSCLGLLGRVATSSPLMQQARFLRHTAKSAGLDRKVCAVLGAQWGDEGKGKLVDVLAQKYDIIGRFNGGANAGHTLVVGGKKYAMHLIPCGILIPGKINVIGNGVVLHVPTMFKELDKLNDGGIDWKNRLLVSDRAHLLFDFHMTVDGLKESRSTTGGIGTTKRGIGPCYASKANRDGVRVVDLVNDFDAFATKYKTLAQNLMKQYDFQHNVQEELETYRKFREMVKPMVQNTSFYINSELRRGKTLLAEGANAALLDIDHGTYPFVTSSATASGGICTGLGIAPSKVDCTVGVVKAYTTRVGAGPFPTELNDSVGESIRAVGREFGTTTGRPRRCGWLDIPVVQYSHMLNNYTSLNITKLDVLSDLDEVKIGVAYKLNGKRLRPGQMPAALEDLKRVEVVYESMPGWKCDISKIRTFEELPEAARNYLKRIEELTKIPITWVGVGAGREDMALQGFRFSA